MIMFKWHTGGAKPCFACSRWNGRTFANLAEVPDLPVHPHCECFIEAVDDSAARNELNLVGNDLERVRNGVQQALETIAKYQLSSWFGESVLSAIRRLVDDMQQFAQTVEIFWRNYQDMKAANTIGADKYFHSKANAEAAQLGPTGEAVADFIGKAREVTDFWKYLLRDKMAVESIIEDMNNDLKANTYGRQVGRNNPDTPAGDLVDVYRPAGLDIKY